MSPAGRRLVTLIAALAMPAPAARAQIPEPAGYKMDHYRSPVPATLSGATVVDDETAHEMWANGRAAFVDVLPRPPKPENLPAGTIWRAPERLSIPGAMWLPNTGFGALHETTDAYFRAGMEAATQGDKSRAVVFFCLAECWMSWNAAKRAMEQGYTAVYWYPDGTDGWQFFEWPRERIEPFPEP